MLAGNGYGTQFIPRVGQEVLVSFINFDPDQPIITAVFTMVRMPHRTKKQTQQVWNKN